MNNNNEQSDPILKELTYDELYKLHLRKKEELDNLAEEMQIISDFMCEKYEELEKKVK